RGLDLDLALSRLPESYRRVLTLFYYEDKSHQRVAEMLDMPVGTVKTHLHRARKQLREVLEEQDHAVRRV
ncbi:MAG: sigma-70 family RNA polymerase sigma factor, partial [bacterium]|nr:sigma-70 family RNA polymerase sigma factor [bacterium]